MREIKGIEKAELVIGRWNPSDLAIIEALEWKGDQDTGASILVIQTLFQQRAAHWPDLDKEMFRVVLVFEGVGGLRLKDFGGGAVQIMGFDIHFVGDRGLEGVNYEISDYEDDRIRFSCGSVSVQSVGPVGPGAVLEN